MKVTISVNGKNLEYSTQFSLRRFISVTVLCSLVLLVSSRSTESVYENHIRLTAVTTGLQEQRDLIQRLKSDNQQQVDGIVSNLAGMQAQLTRLDLLSEQLAAEAGLETQDFKLPPELITDNVMEHDLNQKYEMVEQALEYKIQQLEALESILLGLNIEHQSKLAGRPIEKGWLSSYYGVRKDPFTGKPTMHQGVDFAGEAGNAVVATGAGIVTWSGKRSGYGNLIEIDHGNGLRTRYGHNETLVVTVGDVVTRGQTVALMGTTGRSTGVHVHYEVLRDGKRVDPLPYIYR